MNRKMRRAGQAVLRQSGTQKHWAEVRRIKREYDALSDAEKAEFRPLYAAQIDEHLAAIAAN